MFPVHEVILNEPRSRTLAVEGEAASVAQYVRMDAHGHGCGGACTLETGFLCKLLILNGGEGGIRTHRSLMESVTY